MNPDLGQLQRISWQTADLDSNPAAPDSQTLTVTLPDQSTFSPDSGDVITDATGEFHYDYLTSIPGLHRWDVAVTGAVNAFPAADYFTAVSWMSMLGLAEAKAHLNITETTDDAELRTFMQAATEGIEGIVGAVVVRSFTDEIYDGALELVLPHRPVVSVATVASIWPGGPSWTTSQLLVSTKSGIVRRSFPWPFYWGPWNVTYTAGLANPPERYRQACRELLRHLWESQRGTEVVPPEPGDEEYTTSWGASFSMPARVLDMLDGDGVPAV